MINIIIGDIFKSNCQTIVNTVNCVGAMGKGIALEYKKRYPEMYKKYYHYCHLGLFEPGKLWIYKSSDKWVLNFPTKLHWQNPSEIRYLELGLQKFLDTYKQQGVTSIAFPLLGASNGGIDPVVSLEIMYRYLSQCDDDIVIEIYNNSMLQIKK